MKHIKHWFIAILTIVSFDPLGQLCAQSVLTCASEETETFSFPIGLVHQSTQELLAGARSAGAQEFAVSSLGFNADSFVPLAAQIASVNNQNNQTNPLYDQSIGVLSPFSRTVGSLGSTETALAVTQANPQAVFLTTRINAIDTRVLSLSLIDGNNQPTNGIVSLESVGSAAAMNAVLGNGNTDFTLPFGGLTRIRTNKIQPPGKIEDEEVLVQDPLATFIPLNAQTDALTIGSNLTTIDAIIPLHYDPLLQILYVGICGQAGATANDGIRAVARVRFDNVGCPLPLENSQTFALEIIAPEAVFSGSQNKIVGAIGADQQVCIHALDVLRISFQVGTFIPGPTYLIVLGSNGDASSTRKEIFALPIVSHITSTDNQDAIGQLANVNQQPETITSSRIPNRIIFRGFTEPAVAASQVFTSNSLPARVGGGPLDADIIDIFVSGTAVFAVAQQGTSRAGLFYSEPIIDPEGVILGWSNWQRYGNIAQTILAAAVVTNRPRAISFQVTGNGTAVRSTTWTNSCSTGYGPLNTFVNSVFSQPSGGVHAAAQFPTATPGLDDIGLLSFAGANGIVLSQTQEIEQGIEQPVTGQSFVQNSQNFLNDAISFPIDPSTRTISITGPILESIGCKTAVTIGTQTTANPQGFIFVGGVNGLAVLIQQNGNGFAANPGIGSGFSGLQTGLGFVIIPGFENIRALSADSSFLYILQDTRLVRIDLNASNFAAGPITSTVLATPVGLHNGDPWAGFTDVLVSQKLCFLGTTFGLFVNGSGTNISTAQDIDALSWQEKALPGSTNHVVSLSTLTMTARSEDVSAGTIGGILYVLSGDVGLERSRVNRFTIESTEISTVSQDTVRHIDDQLYTDLDSFYAAFGTYRSLFSTDSSLLLTAQNAAVSDTVRNGRQVINAELKTQIEPTGLTISLGSGFIDRVASISHAPGSGAWLAISDAGLLANE